MEGWLVFQKYIESGLFKMMVRCKCIGKTHAIHVGKAGTISEAPFLLSFCEHVPSATNCALRVFCAQTHSMLLPGPSHLALED